MKKSFLLSCITIGVLLLACKAQKATTASATTAEAPLAFPTAEGFGKYSTGGRGGKILFVTNLNDDGDGSLRNAVEANFPRIVVFKVAGTIHLNSKLNLKANLTLAGQTAPGDGICIADQPVVLAGDNIIVRYLRFRMGDKFQKGGMKDGNGADDAFGGTKRKNIIIDHCSLSWSTDEVFSIYNGDSTTLQWNLISEPLNYSYHFEEGDKDYENHGYGAIWGGAHLTAHHNLFAHCNSRTPRFNGSRQGVAELVDFRNNVIYNWGHNNAYAGEGGHYNIVNNYYRFGPSTVKNVRFRIVNPGKTETIDFGKWFVDGNYVDGAADVSRNNWLGIHMGNNATEQEKRAAVIDAPHSVLSINTETALEAFDKVLQIVGASCIRDTLDTRIINDVKNRSGRFIDVQGGFPHGTAFEQTINAWPSLKPGTVATDSDNDGIPDEWERKNGLNPNDVSDAAAFSINRNCMNIETYINSIIK
ncbi:MULTISPECIES: pectate lyase [unclassified Paraflavitalea]|uniref:pectate lyase n=1 Tax=unclassified Paraflavitalea TaxID=2798305 RepID=UPI003D32AFF3